VQGLGLPAVQLARDIGVPTNRVTEILHGSRAVTADMAMQLSAYFRTSPEFWMNLSRCAICACYARRLAAVSTRHRSQKRSMTATRHVFTWCLCALILQGCANSGSTYYGERPNLTPQCGASYGMGNACGGYNRDGRDR
jgi:addiction module HigA family antidote